MPRIFTPFCPLNILLLLSEVTTLELEQWDWLTELHTRILNMKGGKPKLNALWESKTPYHVVRTIMSKS